LKFALFEIALICLPSASNESKEVTMTMGSEIGLLKFEGKIYYARYKMAPSLKDGTASE
jgi:hypothetical protein